MKFNYADKPSARSYTITVANTAVHIMQHCDVLRIIFLLTLSQQ